MKEEVNCNPNNDPNYVSVEEMAGSILRRPDSPGLDFSAGNPSFGELIVIAGTKTGKNRVRGPARNHPEHGGPCPSETLKNGLAKF